MKTQQPLPLASASSHDLFSKQTIENHLSLDFPSTRRLHLPSPSSSLSFYSAAGYRHYPENKPWQFPEITSTSQINVATFKYLLGEHGENGMVYVGPDGVPVYHPPSSGELKRGMAVADIKVTPQEALEKAKSVCSGFSEVSLRDGIYTFHGENMTLVLVGAKDGEVQIKDEWEVVWDELGARDKEHAMEIMDKLSH